MARNHSRMRRDHKNNFETVLGKTERYSPSGSRDFVELKSLLLFGSLHCTLLVKISHVPMLPSKLLSHFSEEFFLIKVPEYAMNTWPAMPKSFLS